MIFGGRTTPFSVNAKPERNAEIFRKWKAGALQVDLAREYSLNPVSIKKIIAVARCAEWRAQQKAA